MTWRGHHGRPHDEKMSEDHRDMVRDNWTALVVAIATLVGLLFFAWRGGWR